MTRLWSRFGVRALSIALLSVGVGGGYYLGIDRETQQNGVSAELAANNEQAELDFMHDRNQAHVLATTRQRAAQQEAERKAAEAAMAEAERARRANEAASRKADRAKEAAAKAAADAAPKAYNGPIPASCNEYSGAKKTGCAILLSSGFGLDQMPCLEKLWDKESGWNYKSYNASSGAYGIPQALPGSKMATVASDWKTNPATQIKWGLNYIEGRYSTPCNAWSHSQSTGWY